MRPTSDPAREVLAAADKLLLRGHELMEASGVWRAHVIKVHDLDEGRDAIWGPYPNAVEAGDAIPQVLARMAEIAGLDEAAAQARFRPALHWLRSLDLGN